eukprot:scaffold3383_cov412-Prasinococcus_capsulatus_cf.AAC.7
MADGREIATIPEESALTVYQELKQQSSKTQITPAVLLLTHPALPLGDPSVCRAGLSLRVVL